MFLSEMAKANNSQTVVNPSVSNIHVQNWTSLELMVAVLRDVTCNAPFIMVLCKSMLALQVVMQVKISGFVLSKVVNL